MKILFFTKHEINWGSGRERVGVYLDSFTQRGYICSVMYCIPNRLSMAWIGGKTGNTLVSKIYSFWYSRIIKNLKLIWIIIFAKRFDIIFIQKLNLTYPLLTMLSSRNKNIVFDYDDLCFNIANQRSILVALRQYKRIIAGNGYLADIAIRAKGNEGVTVIPTAIDCNFYTFKEKVANARPIVIGWAGSGENHFRHLELLVTPLRQLQKRYDFTFKLLGAMRSEKILSLFAFLGSRFVAVDWLAMNELPAAIQEFDVGLMPLRDNLQARGKCGFKVLQYMATGAAVVASPVGVNAQIIRDGENGLLASDDSGWIEKISSLIDDRQLRRRLALEARKTVQERYSLEVTSQSLLRVLSKV